MPSCSSIHYYFVLQKMNDDDVNKMDDDSMKVRTMDIPVWLSTPEVTSKFGCLLV